jgi:hypothetical protein
MIPQVIPYSVSLTQAVHPLCCLSADLRKLPVEAFSKQKGERGQYYQISYELGVMFGPAGIDFRLMYQGKVVGFVDSEYHEDYGLTKTAIDPPNIEQLATQFRVMDDMPSGRLRGPG